MDDEVSNKLTILLFPEDAIIPDGQINLMEKIIKTKNERWTFHKYDKDFSPSEPHGHNYETGEKLNIHTGEVYKGKIHTRTLGDKQIKYLQIKLFQANFVFEDKQDN